MHPSVADATECDEVFRNVVCRIQVDMMNMKALTPTTDDTTSPVTIHDRVPYHSPSPQGVLLPCRDGDTELLTEERATITGSKRASVAESEETVSIRAAATGRG